MRFAGLVGHCLGALGLGAVVVVATPQRCDVSQAYSILQHVYTASAFCSSLLYPHGIHTRTTTTTVDKPQTSCFSATKTKTEHTVETDMYVSKVPPQSTDLKHGHFPHYADDKFSTQILSGLPQLTSTGYSSTVFITRGATHPVDRREPQTAAAPDNRRPDPTPSALSTCADSTVSAACASLVPEPTVTTTETKTGKACTTTVATTTATVVDRTVTSTYTLTVTSPVVRVTSPGVKTTAVPAQCLGPLYVFGGQDPDDRTDLDEYPNYAFSDVECCAYCYRTKDCVASYWDSDGGACERLVRKTPTMGKSDQCPLGIENANFTMPGEGSVIAGPCGR